MKLNPVTMAYIFGLIAQLGITAGVSLSAPWLCILSIVVGALGHCVASAQYRDDLERADG